MKYQGLTILIPSGRDKNIFNFNSSVYFIIFKSIFTWSNKSLGWGATPCSFNFLYIKLRKIFTAQNKGAAHPDATCLMDTYSLPFYQRSFLYVINSSFTSKVCYDNILRMKWVFFISYKQHMINIEQFEIYLKGLLPML